MLHCLILYFEFVTIEAFFVSKFDFKPRSINETRHDITMDGRFPYGDFWIPWKAIAMLRRETSFDSQDFFVVISFLE